MDAHRQVEVVGCLVYREEVGVGDPTPQVRGELEEAGRAPVAGPAELVHGGVDVEIGQDRHPANTAVALPALLGQPAVVALAQRDPNVWIAGQVMEEECGEDDLGLDAQLVHVAHPSLDVL